MGRRGTTGPVAQKGQYESNEMDAVGVGGLRVGGVVDGGQ
jgi:hypothetical protein